MPLTKKTIFIIEDNEMFAMIMDFNIKENINANITIFSSGEECVERLSVMTPDLIILDYFLKGMDGMQTLREIKKINAKIPVVVLSGQTDMQVAIDLISEGADNYIEKKDNPIVKLIKYIEKISIEKKK